MNISKRAVIALLLVLSVVVIAFTANASAQQHAIADKLIRLHVIANSDSEYDQNMKLFVRDAVINKLKSLLSDAKTRDEAAVIISNSTDIIRSAAGNAVNEFGGNYDVNVSLLNENFSTREYETFSLPAGEYLSLKVTIGEGAGKNWWCVVFPPICFSAATHEELTEMSFTDSEIDFITGKDDAVTYKFFILEKLEKIKEIFKS